MCAACENTACTTGGPDSPKMTRGPKEWQGACCSRSASPGFWLVHQWMRHTVKPQTPTQTRAPITGTCLPGKPGRPVSSLFCSVSSLWKVDSFHFYSRAPTHTPHNPSTTNLRYATLEVQLTAGWSGPRTYNRTRGKRHGYGQVQTQHGPEVNYITILTGVIPYTILIVFCIFQMLLRYFVKNAWWRLRSVAGKRQ